MRAIHDDVRGQARGLEAALALRHVRGVEVRLAPAAQHDVRVGVARRGEDGGEAVLGDAEEVVLAERGGDAVHAGVERAVGAVLEADGRREAGGDLAVRLRLGGAGADGGPADEVADVLRGERVEHLRRGGDAELGDGEQEAAREAEAVLDAEGVVEVGVVDEALPAEDGARLLEVDAHDDHDRVGDFVRKGAEAAGVLGGAVEAVDRAGADDREEAGVVAVEDALDRLAAALDGPDRGRRLGDLLAQGRRRRQRLDRLDVDVLEDGIRHRQC